MQRLRLKANGIVELQDGQEVPPLPTAAFTAPADRGSVLPVRDLRLRARLMQQQFAEKLSVPVETIRNWEQG